MKHLLQKRITRWGCLGLALLLCAAIFPAFPALPTAADGEDSAYIAPAYVVDFSTYEGIDGCTDPYHLTPELSEEKVMRIRFADNGGGVCDDPYMSLPLPGKVDCTQYHVLAMIVRTNKQDLRGEFRFRTTSTGDYYPCQFFNYQHTDDWQLIVVDLTRASGIQYAPATISLTGNFTNIRLDMFNNACPTDTLYEIKAYALYENAQDAATFIHYVSSEEQKEQDLADLDYSAFWRGEAYASPALPMRMRWVTYGFTNTSPVDKFLRQGYGGIVSNVNFNDKYLLDDKEFNILSDVYRYAAGQGMTTWIYDEYQWPSGKAFGQVLEGHDEYQATGVQHKAQTGQGGTASYTCAGQEIRIMHADLTDADGTRSLEISTDGQSVSASASGGWTLNLYVLRYTYEGVENRNDFTTLRHVDLLNKAAVQRFIMLTHERYRDKMGDAFALVEGFFTDEPQLGNRAMVGYVVWTDGLEQTFKDTYGYDLYLPSLFFGDSDADRMCRMNYFQLVARLFKEAYIDQISAWCETNGTASSGHLLFEENMNDQIETYGGDFLQVVGGMTIPGVDLLWVDPTHLMSKNYIGSVVGIRYVVSAAKNAGKDDVMVEFNPDAANTLSKTNPLGECVGGLSMTRLLGTTIYNVINPQLSLTNAEINQLNTYIGRLNTLLDGATECGQVALFYPIATVQALHNADTGHTSEKGTKSAAIDLDTRYQTICRTLLQNQYLYTVIDDQSLQTATVASDGCLCIGQGAYKVMILPMTQYISVEAMQTLVRFRAAGGTVLFVGDTPVHGLKSGDEQMIDTLMRALGDCPSYTVTSKTLYSDLEKYVTRDLAVSAASGRLMSQLMMGDFETADKDISYLVNTADTEAVYRFRYTDGYQGEVTIYQPFNGMIRTVMVGEDEVELAIPGYQAILIVRDAVNDHLSGHTPYVPAEETDVPQDTPSETDTAPEEVTQSVASETLTTTAPEASATNAVESTTTPVTNTPSDKGCTSLLTVGSLLTLLPAAWVLTRRRRRGHETERLH